MLSALFGFLSGIISGMGIGGGVILIPLLIIFSDVTQQQAQGINLLYFIPTAIAALIVHFKNNKIKLNFAVKLILYSLPWAVGASFAAVSLKSEILQKMFACMLFAFGIYEFFSKEEKDDQAD